MAVVVVIDHHGVDTILTQLEVTNGSIRTLYDEYYSIILETYSLSFWQYLERTSGGSSTFPQA